MPTSYTKQSYPTTSFTKETKPQGTSYSFLVGNPIGLLLALTYAVAGDGGATSYIKQTYPTTNFTKEIKP